MSRLLQFALHLIMVSMDLNVHWQGIHVESKSVFIPTDVLSPKLEFQKINAERLHSATLFVIYLLVLCAFRVDIK